MGHICSPYGILKALRTVSESRPNTSTDSLPLYCCIVPSITHLIPPRYLNTRSQMATLSALRISKSQPRQQRHASSQSAEGIQASHPNMVALQHYSILHFNDIALPIGNLFGDSQPGTTFRRHDNFDTPTHHGQYMAPSDGPETATSWYCSTCGDGPTGIWQPSCVSCGHVRCDSCLRE
jgi:hypothetical protein